MDFNPRGRESLDLATYEDIELMPISIHEAVKASTQHIKDDVTFYFISIHEAVKASTANIAKNKTTKSIILYFLHNSINYI